MANNISSNSLKCKWTQDYGKLKPNDCYRAYCIGYRRALRDIENKKSKWDMCKCGHQRRSHEEGEGICYYNANVHIREGKIIGKDCYCKRFTLKEKNGKAN